MVKAVSSNVNLNKLFNILESQFLPLQNGRNSGIVKINSTSSAAPRILAHS